MALYRVVTDMITFPDREPLAGGADIDGDEIAAFLPRLLATAALEPVAIVEDQVRLVPEIDPTHGYPLCPADCPGCENCQLGPNEDLDRLTVKELRSVLKALGISPYPEKRADIVAAIVAERQRMGDAGLPLPKPVQEEVTEAPATPEATPEEPGQTSDETPGEDDAEPEADTEAE